MTPAGSPVSWTKPGERLVRRRRGHRLDMARCRHGPSSAHVGQRKDKGAGIVPRVGGQDDEVGAPAPEVGKLGGQPLVARWAGRQDLKPPRVAAASTMSPPK